MNLNATLLGQMITFALFVIFTIKFVWPPIMKALEQRRKKIAEGLAAAERGQHDLEVAKHKAKEIVREAKTQAAVIIEQANQRAHKIDEAAREDGRKIIEKMNEIATSDIYQDKLKAKSELQNEIVGIAMKSAEKIIGHNLDEAANTSLIEDLLQEVKQNEQ